MTGTNEIEMRENLSSNILTLYKQKVVSAEEAVRSVKSNDKILVHSNCAFPSTTIEALVKRKDELVDVSIYHALAVGNLPYLSEDMKNSFTHYAFFIGPNSRKAVQEGRAEFIPIFLSEVPLLFISGAIKLDVAIIHVSPPDVHGFCSYGVEVGLTKAGAERAKIIIAQVNSKMPRTLGNSFIHVSKIDYIIEVNEEINELTEFDKTISDEEKNTYNLIGKNVASLIEDESTLQLGIGAIPNSVLQFLLDKKDLGVHSELFSDGVIDLIEKGVITNEKKTLHPGKVIAGFVLGSKKLYHFIDNNPIFEFHSQEYVNDPFIIAKNDKMVAINSAIEVDITGQVCADSIGDRMYSGFGGQLDFIRGASRSKDGKPIIALPATTKNQDISRIVIQLKSGAGVVTTKGDVHYIVTEFGIARLYGKTIRERVQELINVAHPKFREELQKSAHEKSYL